MSGTNGRVTVSLRSGLPRAMVDARPPSAPTQSGRNPQVRRGLARGDGRGAEGARHGGAAEPRQRPRAERMTVTAADVDHRRLAVCVDAIEVGLQHRAASGREQPFDVCEGLVALDALIAGRIA